MKLAAWAEYHRFRDRFGEVLDPRFHTLEWLDRQIIGGDYKFWPGREAALVTEIRSYPTGAKEIHAVIAAGDARELIESLAPQAEQYGRTMGCLRAVVESRTGWAKALKSHAYETHQLTVRKEL